MIDEEYFDPTAPEGVPVRYLHKGCSEHKGDSCLVVTRTSSGWKYTCHRCKESGYRGLNGLSPNIVASFAKATYAPSHTTVRQVALPEGRINKYVRESARAWLMKYDITDAEFNRYGIYQAWDRLVFPVFDEYGTPVYWQSRGFTAGAKKWINQRQVGRTDIYWNPNDVPTTNDIVLVEDIVSGIKVNRVRDCIALLGSYIPDDLVINLCKDYKTVYIWLDSDKASYTFNKWRRFVSFGLPVRRIYSPKDPKAYSEEKILDFIEGRCGIDIDHTG